MELEECGVCGDILNSSTVTTKCNHKFHYDCILMTFSTSKEVRECPYCRGDAGYLALPENATPLLNIHKEYKSKSKSSYVYKPISASAQHICTAVFKSGKFKGQQCTHYKKPDSEFCGIHSKKK